MFGWDTNIFHSTKWLYASLVHRSKTATPVINIAWSLNIAFDNHAVIMTLSSKCYWSFTRRLDNKAINIQYPHSS